MRNRIILVGVILIGIIGVLVFIFSDKELAEVSPSPSPRPALIFPRIIDNKTITEAGLGGDIKKLIWPNAYNILIQSTVYDNKNKGYLMSYSVNNTSLQFLYSDFNRYLIGTEKWTFVRGVRSETSANLEVKKGIYGMKLNLIGKQNNTIGVEIEVIEGQ